MLYAMEYIIARRAPLLTDAPAAWVLLAETVEANHLGIMAVIVV